MFLPFQNLLPLQLAYITLVYHGLKILFIFHPQYFSPLLSFCQSVPRLFIKFDFWSSTFSMFARFMNPRAYLKIISINFNYEYQPESQHYASHQVCVTSVQLILGAKVQHTRNKFQHVKLTWRRQRGAGYHGK